jgi:hypothetical protein
VGTLAIQGGAALMSREALLLNGSAHFDANSLSEVPTGTPASESMTSKESVMRKVLLSDIDGTLVDSNGVHADSWRRSFEHFGIEVGLDEAWSQIGKGGDQLIPVFVRPQDRRHLEDGIKKYRDDLMKREYMSRMVPFAKARELLMRVKAAGMKIVLATSAKRDDLAFYKQLVGMEDLVEDEATSSDANNLSLSRIYSRRRSRRPGACRKRR